MVYFWDEIGDLFKYDQITLLSIIRSLLIQLNQKASQRETTTLCKCWSNLRRLILWLLVLVEVTTTVTLKLAKTKEVFQHLMKPLQTRYTIVSYMAPYILIQVTISRSIVFHMHYWQHFTPRSSLTCNTTINLQYALLIPDTQVTPLVDLLGLTP